MPESELMVKLIFLPLKQLLRVNRKTECYFSKNIYEGKNLITVYRWDARDPEKPIWSQASSEDLGVKLDYVHAQIKWNKVDF